MIIAVISVLVLMIVSAFFHIKKMSLPAECIKKKFDKHYKEIMRINRDYNLDAFEEVYLKLKILGFKESIIIIGMNFIAAVMFVFFVWLTSITWIYLEGLECVFALWGILAVVGGLYAAVNTADEKDDFTELMEKTLLILVICVGGSMILYAVWFIWYWFCGGFLLDPIVGKQSVGDKIVYFLMSVFVLVYLFAYIRNLFR